MMDAECYCGLPDVDIVLARDPQRTAEWYHTCLGFKVRRNVLGDFVLDGFGETVVLQSQKDAERTPLFDAMPSFKVTDVPSLRRQFLAQGLKLVRDADIPGLGCGYIEVEDCDGRIIRFEERKNSELM